MPTKKQVLSALQKVKDPEIGESIVDLGFVREVEIDGKEVKVIMTLTTPFCPMANIILGESKGAIMKIKGVQKAEVELDFETPWSPEMMKDGIRKKLGLD